MLALQLNIIFLIYSRPNRKNLFALFFMRHSGTGMNQVSLHKLWSVFIWLVYILCASGNLSVGFQIKLDACPRENGLVVRVLQEKDFQLIHGNFVAQCWLHCWVRCLGLTLLVPCSEIYTCLPASFRSFDVFHLKAAKFWLS